MILSLKYAVNFKLSIFDYFIMNLKNFNFKCFSYRLLFNN